MFQSHTDRTLDLGFSASVLSLIPFGLIGKRQKDAFYRYEIEKVEGQTFLPSHEYVQKSVLQPEVLDYLARFRYRKSLYMIVGVKIGFNAEILYQTKQ